MKQAELARKLGVSRQRVWSMNQRKIGKCSICAKKALTLNHCLKHAVLHREYQRKLNGSARRNNSLSYRLEKQK